MRKIISILIFFLLSTQLIAQSKEGKTFGIIFRFNDYVVCDLEGNSQFHIFYIDSTDFYCLDTLNIYNRNKVNVNLDFEKIELIGIIFQYKDYVIIFAGDKDVFTRNEDNNLEFRIAKKHNYKKYIRKSYSKRKEKNRLLYVKHFDVSCNGWVDGPKVFSHICRKEWNQFSDYAFKKGKKYNELCYECGGEWVSCSSQFYKNYNKFFSGEKKLFQKVLFVVGKEKSYIEPSLIYTLEVK